LEDQRRPAGDVRCVGAQGEFVKADLGERCGAFREFRPGEEVGGGFEFAVGLELDQAFPQALGGGHDIAGLVKKHDGIRCQIEQRMLADVIDGGGEFPAGGLVVGLGLLAQGQNFGLGQLEHAALGLDIEAADGFDFVAKEFDAQGLRVFGAKDVKDAAADGVLADHFHGVAAFVADGLEVFFDRLQRYFFAFAQGE
jgi:hypothetical protein